MTRAQDTKTADDNHAMVVETLGRLLERALTAMNDAVVLTDSQGPAVAMEFIANYLNDNDAADERASDVSDDWLDQWDVTQTGSTSEVTP